MKSLRGHAWSNNETFCSLSSIYENLLAVSQHISQFETTKKSSRFGLHDPKCTYKSIQWNKIDTGWAKSKFTSSKSYNSETMHFNPMLVKPKCVLEAQVSYHFTAVCL